MKKLSRISIIVFLLLFCSLCVMNVYSESKYKGYDNKAIGLLYQGSIYKAQKEYKMAKELYNQSLALAHSPKLRKEIEEALYYIDKYLSMFHEE